MHLNQIASFIAVSKTLNFTAAARQLGVPQSTISRQIGDLEAQLGVRLFFRTKRDVRLTHEGTIFLPYAQEIAEAARRGSNAVKQIHEGASGRLSIATTTASERFVSACLVEFHKKYPDIVVDISRISSGMALMDENETTYDFFFLYREMLPETEKYDYIHTHKEKLGIAFRRESKESKSKESKSQEKASKDPQALAAASFILLSEESDPIVYMQAMNYCRTHRFKPNIVNTFEDIQSVVLSVSAGLGISFLPVSLPENSPSGNLQIVPLDDESYDIDCIAAWDRALLNPAASLFLEILKDKVI